MAKSIKSRGLWGSGKMGNVKKNKTGSIKKTKKEIIIKMEDTIRSIKEGIEYCDIKKVKQGFDALREYTFFDDQSNSYYNLFPKIRTVDTDGQWIYNILVELESQIRNFSNNYIERSVIQNYINKIAEIQNELFIRIGETDRNGDAYKYRFFIQQIMIDMAFVAARDQENRESAIKLIAIYYDLLRKWNEERMDILEFQSFFGEEARHDVIARTYDDLIKLSEIKKSDGCSVIETILESEKRYIKAFAYDLKEYFDNNTVIDADKGYEVDNSSVSNLNNEREIKSIEPELILEDKKKLHENRGKEQTKSKNEDNLIEISKRKANAYTILAILLALLIFGLGFMIGLLFNEHSASVSTEAEIMGEASTNSSDNSESSVSNTVYLIGDTNADADTKTTEYMSVEPAVLRETLFDSLINLNTPVENGSLDLMKNEYVLFRFASDYDMKNINQDLTLNTMKTIWDSLNEQDKKKFSENWFVVSWDIDRLLGETDNDEAFRGFSEIEDEGKKMQSLCQDSAAVENWHAFYKLVLHFLTRNNTFGAYAY